MRSTVSMLSILAPVIFLTAACENEGRQTVAGKKHIPEPDPFATETVAAKSKSDSSKEPTCVKISTKFVEITSGTEELDFDWITEPFGTGTTPSEDEESSSEN